MRVSRTGALPILVVTILWTMTPAIARLVPTHQMTKAEHDLLPEDGAGMRIIGPIDRSLFGKLSHRL
jgi:hypothetical protein